MINIEAEPLRLYVERIERLEEQKKERADDIRDVYSEAGSMGYDKKMVRQIVKLRKIEAQQRAEMDAILEVYREALNV
jgi:uncharacterized protein (UPF0335 family)